MEIDVIGSKEGWETFTRTMVMIQPWRHHGAFRGIHVDVFAALLGYGIAEMDSRDLVDLFLLRLAYDFHDEVASMQMTMEEKLDEVTRRFNDAMCLLSVPPAVAVLPVHSLLLTNGVSAPEPTEQRRRWHRRRRRPRRGRGRGPCAATVAPA